MGHARLSPSLKVQSWLRMEPNASSFDSVASSATLRSTYTIICFSCATKTCFSDNSRNTNTDRSQKHSLASSMSQNTRNAMLLLWDASSCMRADVHFDLWVCFISWIPSLSQQCRCFWVHAVLGCLFATVSLSRNSLVEWAAKRKKKKNMSGTNQSNWPFSNSNQTSPCWAAGGAAVSAAGGGGGGWRALSFMLLHNSKLLINNYFHVKVHE